jgi:hypothetical protein
MNRLYKITMTVLGITTAVGLWNLASHRKPRRAAPFTLRLKPVFVPGPALTVNSISVGRVGHCGNEMDDLQQSGCPIADSVMLWKEITKHDTDY